MKTSATKSVKQAAQNSQEKVLQSNQNPRESFQGIWEYPQTGTAIDETNDAYRVYLAAPGLEKDDFKVNLDEGLLEIEAIKNEEGDEMETSGNSVLFRTLNFPKNVNASQGRATYKDDVLHITIPKRRKSIVDKRTRIRVK